MELHTFEFPKRPFTNLDIRVEKIEKGVSNQPEYQQFEQRDNSRPQRSKQKGVSPDAHTPCIRVAAALHAAGTVT